MAKGKAKISSGEDLPPPARTQSLRSRKRQSASDEAPLSDVEATFHQKGTEGDDTVVTALQSPVQECTVIISQQDRAVEQFCYAKQNGSIADTQAAVTDVDITKEVATAQEEATIRNLSNDFQLENCGLHADDDVRKNDEDKGEMVSDECNKSPGQTYIDQFQVLPLFKEDNESYKGVMEKQVGGEDTSDLEKNQSTSQDTPSTMYVSDLKESPVGLPAKKKRRMGSCALTEKERSSFLQIQNHENGHNGMTRIEKQLYNETPDSVGLEVNVCSPNLPSSLLLTSVGHITEETEREQKVRSSHCGEDGRAETEITVTTSDGTSTVGHPGAEGGTGSGPEIPGNTESCQLAKQEESDYLGNQELQELNKLTTENMDEIPEKEMKRGEDMTGEEDAIFAVTSNPSQNEEIQDAVVAALPEINSLNMTNGEMCVGDTDKAASDTKTWSSGSVELCEAAVTPSVVQRKYNILQHNPDDGPAASPSAENDDTRAKDSSDNFGPGCLDYVSDSQLNTIILTEEEVMKEEEADPSGQLEDASELVCGLIRELSSLNRKVMAAHRELANLRRSGKTSRRSAR